MSSVRTPGEALVPVRGRGSHGPADGPLVGVLGLQGDVLENLRMLRRSGARAVTVKRADELDALDGLVIPGGESTTIGKLAGMYGLLEPLRRRLAEGLPAFGTCAGAILLAREALLDDGRASPQALLGAMDTVVRRNAFGRQVASFEADLDVRGLDGGPVHAVFIRAPWVERAGPGVQVLATVAPRDRAGRPLGERAVLVRQGALLACAFHPELSGDARLHGLFVRLVEQRRRAGA